MRRQLILSLLAVLVAVAAFTIVTRQVLESVVSPGPLSAPHASLRGRSLACHVPFAKAAQNTTCIACHARVGRDIVDHRGYHGRVPASATARCSACHQEHRGPHGDIVHFDPHHFDHRLSDFALTGAHRGVACHACHRPHQAFAAAPSACTACHAKQDVHHGRFGKDCASCHDSRSWKTIHAFDHARTGYPLIGFHRRTACAGCHGNGRLAGTPRTCIACHRNDDVHHGARGSDCAACHTPAGWKLATFDHNRDTRFPLIGAHASAGCVGCHGQNMAQRHPPTTCIACHANKDVHHGQFGADCATCHASTQWQSVHFDHDRMTRFPLKGAHRGVVCTACHVGPLHSVKPPSTCIGCHRADDPHRGRLGPNCASCHNEARWREALGFDHGLTRFPLLGQHVRTPCVRCHVDRSFTAKGLACAACHADDFHKGRLGQAPDCAQCHVPSGWDRWRFDHARQTGFAIDGKHQGLACAACHRVAARTAKLNPSCYSCHRADDAHHGAFGQQCAQCHSTKGFLPATVPARLGSTDASRAPPRECPSDGLHGAVLQCWQLAQQRSSPDDIRRRR
ncbi:cytochrome C [Sphingomonas sp. TREG-RG-20F-R18-01]|uniref:cytochrome C n=1 Tax=Sphingomonas sp. TREG-RG-20F-R18-01 TaxID=2914982 RepID=UPI001F5A9F78|nr:cytochrome C [Sphingomonas sp. TREG-RG-20F-R18-01]